MALRRHPPSRRRRPNLKLRLKPLSNQPTTKCNRTNNSHIHRPLSRASLLNHSAITAIIHRHHPAVGCRKSMAAIRCNRVHTDHPRPISTNRRMPVGLLRLRFSRCPAMCGLRMPRQYWALGRPRTVRPLRRPSVRQAGVIRSRLRNRRLLVPGNAISTRRQVPILREKATLSLAAA